MIMFSPHLVHHGVDAGHRVQHMEFEVCGLENKIVNSIDPSETTSTESSSLNTSLTIEAAHSQQH